MSMSIEETVRFLCINQKQVYQILKNRQLKVNKLNGRKVLLKEDYLIILPEKDPQNL